MKIIFSVLLLMGIFSSDISAPTIYMIGDSTMATKAKKKYPETGWGVPFKDFFKSNIEIKNYAKNGRSTKSFRAEGLWDSVYNSLKENDYVFIQFGHNDEKTDKPLVGTTIEEFEQNLINYVKDVQYKKAKPILLTPIVRRKFVDGKLVDTHHQYGEKAIQVAADLNIPCIDLRTLTHNLLIEKGEQASTSLFLHLDPGHVNYPKGVRDNTHLNYDGAKVIAKIVADEIRKQQILLSNYLK